MDIPCGSGGWSGELGERGKIRNWIDDSWHMASATAFVLSFRISRLIGAFMCGWEPLETVGSLSLLE
jgi:hypothetical protein